MPRKSWNPELQASKETNPLNYCLHHGPDHLNAACPVLRGKIIQKPRFRIAVVLKILIGTSPQVSQLAAVDPAAGIAPISFPTPAHLPAIGPTPDFGEAVHPMNHMPALQFSDRSDQTPGHMSDHANASSQHHES